MGGRGRWEGLAGLAPRALVCRPVRDTHTEEQKEVVEKHTKEEVRVPTHLETKAKS